MNNCLYIWLPDRNYATVYRWILVEIQCAGTKYCLHVCLEWPPLSIHSLHSDVPTSHLVHVNIPLELESSSPPTYMHMHLPQPPSNPKTPGSVVQLESLDTSLPSQPSTYITLMKNIIQWTLHWWWGFWRGVCRWRWCHFYFLGRRRRWSLGHHKWTDERVQLTHITYIIVVIMFSA